MKSRKSDEKKAERLFDIFDDGWEAWPEAINEEEEGHDHPHGAHAHPHGKISTAGTGKAGSTVLVEPVEDQPSPPKRAKVGAAQ